MSIINITDRLIAVEVPKDIRNVSVNKGILTDDWRILSDNYNPKYLKSDNECRMEYICLASENHKYHLLTEEEKTTGGVDRDTLMSILNGEKEYALIRITN